MELRSPGSGARVLPLEASCTSPCHQQSGEGGGAPDYFLAAGWLPPALPSTSLYPLPRHRPPQSGDLRGTERRGMNSASLHIPSQPLGRATKKPH